MTGRGLASIAAGAHFPDLQSPDYDDTRLAECVGDKA